MKRCSNPDASRYNNRHIVCYMGKMCNSILFPFIFSLKIEKCRGLGCTSSMLQRKEMHTMQCQGIVHAALTKILCLLFNWLILLVCDWIFNRFEFSQRQNLDQFWKLQLKFGWIFASTTGTIKTNGNDEPCRVIAPMLINCCWTFLWHTTKVAESVMPNVGYFIRNVQ